MPSLGARAINFTRLRVRKSRAHDKMAQEPGGRGMRTRANPYARSCRNRVITWLLGGHFIPKSLSSTRAENYDYDDWIPSTRKHIYCTLIHSTTTMVRLTHERCARARRRRCCRCHSFYNIVRRRFLNPTKENEKPLMCVAAYKHR